MKIWIDYGYASEYILTGNVNSAWNSTEAQKYQKRNWNQYVNSSLKAQNAVPLTKQRLDKWYSKYMGVANADTYNMDTLKRIYQSPYYKYQNIIDNYSIYTVCTANEYGIIMLEPDMIFYNGFMESYGVYGVRILVTLSPELKLTPQKTGTKTITGGNMTQYGGNQTYNVWGIK